MGKSAIIEKFSVLLAICDNEQESELQEFLESRNLNSGLIFLGKGTAESDIADIFGFGLSDKLITCVLVPEHSQEKIIIELTDVLGIERDHFGLTMLLETSSASSAVMSMLGL
ncbi:MAG: hypothetical protein E7356_05250 [Clostridiales bacterium]|nr:hypothetical protein [Clostridiales bacterium]